MVFHIIVYCFIATAYLLLTLVFQPRIWLHRMPDSVKESVARQSPREKNQLLWLGIPWLVFLISYPVLFASSLNLSAFDAAQVAVTFWLTFVLVDIVLVDLIMLCTLRPTLVMIRGAHPDDYNDIKHHIIEGVRGAILAICAAAFLYLFWPH